MGKILTEVAHETHERARNPDRERRFYFVFFRVFRGSKNLQLLKRQNGLK